MNDVIYTFGYEDGQKTIIKVQIAILKGLPMFQIVGLGGKTIQESKERIMSIINHLPIKKIIGKIIVNLSPANMAKNGTHYDLPICVAMLLKSNIPICINLEDYIIIGELSLYGDILGVKKAILAGMIAKEHNKKIICSIDDYPILSLILDSSLIYAFKNITELLEYFEHEKYTPYNNTNSNTINENSDIIDYYGTDLDILFLKILAGGKHSGIMIGAPGSGKTTMANLLRQVMPPITTQDALEIAEIYEYANIKRPDIYELPFRSPHFTASKVSLIGGGLHQSPGEISLAHKGILFLDEICEFDTEFLTCLCTPLEEKVVHISRANYKTTYNANIMLLAASNPCTCGYSLEINCKCKNKFKHLDKIPGPIRDRIDLSLYVHRRDINPVPKKLNIKEIREHIKKMHDIQLKRYNTYNSELNLSILIQSISEDVLNYAINMCNKYKLSIRSYGKLLKVSRTIADLYNHQNISIEHINIAKTFSYGMMNTMPI